MVRNYSWSLSTTEISKLFDWNNREIMDGYTNILINDYFQEQNPYCVLRFRYRNLKERMSRKRNSAHFSACGHCTHSLCKTRHIFEVFLK